MSPRIADNNPFDYSKTTLEPPAPLSYVYLVVQCQLLSPRHNTTFYHIRREQADLIREEDTYREYLANLPQGERIPPKDLYHDLIDVYDDSRSNWVYSALSPDEERVPCLFRILRERYVAGNASYFTEEEFAQNWRRMTCGMH